jgi:ribosomal protein S27AE
MFACGAIMMVTGHIGDLGHETRIYCEKCGAVEYVPKNALNRFSIVPDTNT